MSHLGALRDWGYLLYMLKISIHVLSTIVVSIYDPHSEGDCGEKASKERQAP